MNTPDPEKEEQAETEDKVKLDGDTLASSCFITSLTTTVVQWSPYLSLNLTIASSNQRVVGVSLLN